MAKGKQKTETQIDRVEAAQELVVETTSVVEETVVEETVVEETVVEDNLPPHVDVKPDTPKKKKGLGKTTGIIYNCNALRLREGANLRTREMAQIPVNTKVSINLDNSTESFYEVTYVKDGVSLIGFCLKEFISVG